MHTVQFKTYVNTGEKEPKELTVEYIDKSDLLVFSVNGIEIFNISYNNNFESIAAAIQAIRYTQKLD